MNVSPVSFNAVTKAPAFKGVEKADEGKTNSSQDLAAIRESIDNNTKALEQIGKIMYASILASSNGKYCGKAEELANRYKGLQEMGCL